MKKIIFAAAALSLLLALSLPLCAEDADAEETLHTCHAELLQEGKLLPESAEGPLLLKAADGTSVFGELDRRFYEAFKKRAEEVDITDLNIKKKDYLDGHYYAAVINNHPDCFYVTGFQSYYSTPEYITRVIIQYDDRYDKADEKAFNDKIDEIISGVDPAWNDEQKALYLHDWLVTHCRYDFTYSKSSAYNALIDGEAMCQGYAVAYKHLCGKVGIEAGYVSVSVPELNHVWNIMKIGGYDYYTDCTWDDPVISADGKINSYEYRCRHHYFLLSRDAMYNEKHDADGWVTDSLYERSQTSDKYADAYWTPVVSPVCLSGNAAYYCVSDKIMRYDYGSGSENELYPFEKYDICDPGSGITYRYTNQAYYILRYGSGLLAAAKTGIYFIELSGECEKILDWSADDMDTGWIMGFRLDGDLCSYDIYKDISENDYIETRTLDLASALFPVLPGDVDSDGAAATPLDAMTLARYFAGWEGYEDISFAASDIDLDQAVTLKDAIILARWIAGWEIYAGYFEP